MRVYTAVIKAVYGQRRPRSLILARASAYTVNYLFSSYRAQFWIHCLQSMSQSALIEGYL